MRDQTQAMALKLAEKKLISLGWKWDARQIGVVAAEIIKALDEGLSPKEPKA
tara:strand:- start:119 stop:274 length:156 start_codon:yes stop_codon:yes gene_type:complete